MDVRGALDFATKKLVVSSGTPQLDAQLLLAHTLEKDRSFLYAHPEHPLSDNQRKAYRQLVEKRCDGQPVAQLTGVQEFWSLPIKVTEDVLIPRPETELLVNLSLAHMPRAGRIDFADLGTGSGAIALAVSIERPNARVVATDTSNRALDVARNNALNLGVSKIDFRHGDWCEALPQRSFDVIVSNPPYIPREDPHLKGDIRHEPSLALVSGEQGLDDLAVIAEQAKAYLGDGAHLILEHGHDQRQALIRLLLKTGYRSVESFDDEAGVPRAVVAVWRAPREAHD